MDPQRFDETEIARNPFHMPDAEAAERAAAYLSGCKAEGDSSGGVVECIIHQLPVGLGDPVFEKLSANLAKAMCSIGAVKSFEIGDGIAASRARGSENNDSFTAEENSVIRKCTNHSGGTLGGISDGSDLLLRIGFKPTPSISVPQQTVSRSGEPLTVRVKGRHDPLIAARAVVVAESMAAITIVDALFANMYARMDSILDFYRK